MPLTFEWDEAAWRLDTEMLSPEARGIWREILGHLYLQKDRSGVITGTREEIARAGRCSAVQADLAIKELVQTRVADVTERNGMVTLVNRRLHKCKQRRDNGRLRVATHRKTGAVTPRKRSCNAPGNAVVTPSPHPPLKKVLSSNKGNDKALSPLSLKKEGECKGETPGSAGLPPAKGNPKPDLSAKALATAETRPPPDGASVPASRPKLETRNVKRLTSAQRECARRFEIILGPQWPNDAGKWVNRIKDPKTFHKSARVVAEVENALKEDRIATTPAQYAEQIWKEFT